MENKKMIFHIVTVNDLKNHTRDNYYKPADFDKDGFIHCTAGKDTTLLVLEDYFVEISRSNEIVILEIDESKIKSAVKYEPPALIQGGGTRHAKEAALFPHIYGCLNIDAITGVGTVRRIDNKFVWPVDFDGREQYMRRGADWEPDRYLKFGNERTQPSIDLVSRIKVEHSPENIVDIGCGPGNSSGVLLQRWPGARVVGIDNSPSMIEKARKDFPDQEWILADAMNFETGITFDIVFSNATIQWIPDHDALIERFAALLSAEGIIAVQVPRFREMTVGRILHSVSRSKRWEKETNGCSELFTYHDFHYYYDLLAGRMRSVDMWETDYCHVLASHGSIIDWIKGAGMRPYLDRISGENDKKEFERDVLGEITKSYPKQSNGNVLFPFKRLFFIGYK